jgi:hypothetical protein
MLTILRLLSLVLAAFRLRSNLALENLALRQQLAIMKRRASTTEAAKVRSNLLAVVVASLVALEGDVGHREARDRRPLAS